MTSSVTSGEAHRRRGFQSAASWQGARLPLPLMVMVLAVLVRAAALWGSPGHLADDRDDYLLVAREFVAHGFWTSFAKSPNSFRPPLYPLVVAAIFKCGGSSGALGLLQLVLGTGTVALTYRLGQKLGLGTLAIVAAGLVAVDPLLVEYTTFPMTETLFTFLVTLLVAVATPARPSIDLNPGESIAKARWRAPFRAILSGTVFGLCALCRPTIWPVAGLAGLWWLARFLRASSPQSGIRLRTILVPGLLAVLSAAVVIAPWVLRNEKLLGTPVVTTTHGGYTLLLGNNESYYHQVAARPFVDVWRDPEPDRFQQAWYAQLIAKMDRELGPAASETAVDRWMYGQAWRAIAAEPKLFLRAALLRFAEFWNVVPLRPSRSSVSSLVVWGLGAGYAIELILFLAGIVTLVRRWDVRWLLPLLLIVNFAAAHLFYWSNMRMRAPLIPLIALLAARAVLIGRDWRTKR